MVVLSEVPAFLHVDTTSALQPFILHTFLFDSALRKYIHLPQPSNRNMYLGNAKVQAISTKCNIRTR